MTRLQSRKTFLRGVFLMGSNKSGHSRGVRSILIGATAILAMAALAIGLSPLASGRNWRPGENGSRSPAAARIAADSALKRGMPIYFEKNQGQVNSSVRYLARSGRYSMFLTNDAAVFS